MKKTFIEWVAYVLLFIWQILQNIVGMALWLILKIKGPVEAIASTKWSKAFKAKAMSGGISLGSFCFVSDYSANDDKVVAHELKGHTWDSRLMGPLYLLIVGLPSLLNASFHFTRCYYDFFTEKWANKRAGLKVTKQCKLSFKDEEEKVKDAVEQVELIKDWKAATTKPEPEPTKENDLIGMVARTRKKIDNLKNR